MHLTWTKLQDKNTLMLIYNVQHVIHAFHYLSGEELMVPLTPIQTPVIFLDLEYVSIPFEKYYLSSST